MVEQIKLIYKPKGFDTKYFSNNESEKDTSKKNVLLILHQVLKKYYQIIIKENVDIILIYFISLNIMRISCL